MLYTSSIYFDIKYLVLISGFILLDERDCIPGAPKSHVNNPGADSRHSRKKEGKGVQKWILFKRRMFHRKLSPIKWKNVKQKNSNLMLDRFLRKKFNFPIKYRHAQTKFCAVANEFRFECKILKHPLS